MNTLIQAPYVLGKLELKNRIVMAPMTRSRAIDNLPNEMMARYYALRASAGLIITEGTGPSPDGLGYARSPALYSATHVREWRQVTDAVHAAGGRIFVQIMHTGRVGHPNNLPPGGRILGPSAIGSPGTIWTDAQGPQPIPAPLEMSESEIFAAVQEHVHAATLAIEAGFDGVELHGANGYLLHQFTNPAANHRTDLFGGSLRNRLRLPLMVARKVAEAIGPHRVGYRVSPFNAVYGLETHDDEAILFGLAEGLRQVGIAYLHLVDPGAPLTREMRARLRSMFNGTLIYAGGYDARKAEDAIRSGHADLIGFGSGFIANPDFVDRLRTGRPLREADRATLYTPGEKGYLDYPVEG